MEVNRTYPSPSVKVPCLIQHETNTIFVTSPKESKAYAAIAAAASRQLHSANVNTTYCLKFIKITTVVFK